MMAHFSTQHVREQAERLMRQKLEPALYRDREPVIIESWEAAGEPVPFAQAVQQGFGRVELGLLWGKPWGTTWFHITGEVPARFACVEGTSVELIVDLGFNETQTGFQCEALAYTREGKALKAVEPFNRYVRLAEAGPGSTVNVYLEAASNPDVVNDWSFDPTWQGAPSTMGDGHLYTLREVAIGLRDEHVAALYQDLFVLLGLAREIGEDTTRGTQIMAAVSRSVHALDSMNVAGTAQLARAELAEVLASPAHASSHRIAAVGHAHIDSAWLWPIRETARKVARTFSNVIDLAEQDPEFVFAASSAQQYAWLKHFHPDVFENVKKAVARGQFVPVGGQWVEADSNLPGGEASVRQFVEGTKFFRSEFDFEPKEVWLPDSFGYSGAMPQIARLAGARWFLTQKLSWNEVNRMPHHTFWWEGIDGTRVFTHFPPADTYNSELDAADVHRAEQQFSEKSAANVSLIPFGYGDGGGGPTREMLERAHRMQNLEGSPRVTLTGPRQFFDDAQQDYPNAPVWSGEMYLEFHRGVFTSQSLGKRGNRRSEALLHEAELWAATAAVRVGADYPYDVLERIWRLVLLYQFHDILPGTCIAWVHQEVVAQYAEIEAELEGIISRSIAGLVGDGSTALLADSAPNAFGMDGFGIRAAEFGSSGVEVIDLGEGSFQLGSAHARIVVDSRGRITSAVDLASGREAILAGGAGNTLELFRDEPTTWDAWNIDHDYEAVRVQLEAHRVQPDGEAVVVETSMGNSTIKQRISLEPGRAAIRVDTHVDWHEQDKLLKLGFELDVMAEHSTSEVQFGHVNRPTHRNTTWDAARYEIPAHRWIYVGEGGYGVALANSVTYGHDVSRIADGESRTGTRLRASLLRAPRYPDPESDLGQHAFSHVLRLAASIEDAADEGYRLHWPVREVQGSEAVTPLVRVEGTQARVETVKLAEDRGGDLVVRLYESLGGRTKTRLFVDSCFTSAIITDLHEDAAEPMTVIKDGDSSHVEISLRPFQVLTVRFSKA